VTALSASLLTHGLVLGATLGLLQRSSPPVPLSDTAVVLQFVAAPAAAVARAAPPPSEPATAVETPAPPVEPQAQASGAETDEATPLPPPPAPPDITERAPAPREQPAIAAEPKPEPPPAPVPRPVQSARPHRAVALHQPSPSAATASIPAAATAIAAVLPARPVVGMESDRPPVYPETARRRGQQGRVLLQVDVSPQGTPVEVSVAQSSGFASLDDAAMRAVQQWRFVPATRAGTPIPAVAEVPVRFRLTN
jgi:periplasmic protein TonB